MNDLEKQEKEWCKNCLEQQFLKDLNVHEAVKHAVRMERLELGNVLHDNVNQILGAAKLYIHTAQSEQNQGGALLKRSSQLIETAIQEIRKISQDLYKDCPDLLVQIKKERITK